MKRTNRASTKPLVIFSLGGILAAGILGFNYFKNDQSTYKYEPLDHRPVSLNRDSENSAPFDLRSLDKAFSEIADYASPAVVDIKVLADNGRRSPSTVVMDQA